MRIVQDTRQNHSKMPISRGEKEKEMEMEEEKKL